MTRYHHGDLRAALIAAGMEMARQDGGSALGMRELARAVGVSPNAAYRHFANLRAMVLTVAQEAQHRLALAILGRRDAIPVDTEPAGRALGYLRAFGLGYIQFALSEPGWFALTCESQQTPPDVGPRTGNPPTPHQLLLDALDAMVEAGALSSERRVDAEWSCWATIHGFAIMATSGPLQGMDPTAAGRLADHVIATLTRGLRS